MTIRAGYGPAIFILEGMMKLTADDWEALMADDDAWDGVHYDEALFCVGGEEMEELPEDLPRDAVIEIVGGAVVKDETGAVVGDLTTFVERYLKKHKQRRVVVIVPTGVTDEALNELLGSIGGHVAR